MSNPRRAGSRQPRSAIPIRTSSCWIRGSRRSSSAIPAIQRIATGFDFTEGPVWFGDGRYLLFTDIPNDQILRWDETTGGISVFRSPSHYANGNTRDRQGRLITCEHDTQRLTRTEYDGTVVVLADSSRARS